MKTVYLLVAAFFISFLSIAQKKPNILIIVSHDHAYQSIAGYRSKLMKTRTLGPKGPEVSALALGCMGMTDFYGQRDDKKSIATTLE